MLNWKKIRISKGVLVFLILAVINILIYWKLKDNFFRADEWSSYATAHTNPVWSGFIGNGVHYSPLGVLILSSFYKWFKLTMWAFAIVAISLHTINSFLVYKVSRFFARFEIAVIAAIVFATSTIAMQIITWFSTITTSMTCAALSLISLWFFVKAWKKRKNVKKNLAFALIFAVLAILTKEYAIFLFLLYAVWWFVLDIRKVDKTWWRKLKFPLVSMGIFLGYAAFRYLTTLIFPDRSVDIAGTFDSGQAGNIFGQLIRKFFLTPAESYWNVFIYRNIDFIKESLENIPRITYSVVILGMILAIIFLLKKKERRYNLFFWVIFIFFAFTPFAFLNLNASQIEERYLYIPLAGASILAVVAIYYLLEQFLRRKLLIVIITVCVFATPIIWNISSVSNRLDSMIATAQERRSFLTEIRNDHAELPSRVIFLFEGNYSYYALRNMPIPFPSGIGLALMDVYLPTNPEFKELVREHHFASPTETGIHSGEDSLVGVFYSKKDMLDFISANPVAENVEIISYFYDSENKELVNTTKETEAEIKSLLTATNEISIEKIQTNGEEDDLNFLNDQNRETVWDFGEAYKPGQYLEIEFSGIENVSRIRLLTPPREVPNAFAIGYRIYISTDASSWNQVYQSNPNAPNEDGLTEILFPPQATKYLKIEQIGTHGASYWSLSEVEILGTDNK